MLRNHCDRCDVVLQSDELPDKIVKGHIATVQYMELCRFCRRSFNRWMNSYEDDKKASGLKSASSGTIVDTDPELTSLNPEYNQPEDP